jgi:shikimate 5-dehydrogenase
MKEAAAAGAETENGLEMLVAQGTRAFRFWTHRAAPEAAMREGLAAALEGGTAARRAR